MRKLLFLALALLPLKAFGSGCPIYTHEDNNVNEEFKQICTALERYNRSDVAIDSSTANQFTFNESTGSRLKITTNLTVPTGTKSTDAAAFGQLKVIQTTTTFSGAATTTTSGSFQMTTLVSTITLTVGNAVLVSVTSSVGADTAGDLAGVGLTRNGTVSSQIIASCRGGGSDICAAGFHWIDYPPAGSTNWYKMQLKNATGGGTVRANSGIDLGEITLQEIVYP